MCVCLHGCVRVCVSACGYVLVCSVYVYVCVCVDNLSVARAFENAYVYTRDWCF